MPTKSPQGSVYFCPVCGAELTVLAPRLGVFNPVCCNRPMALKPRRVMFYYCPVCGAQLLVVRPGAGAFAPRCCNTAMVRKAA